jgi:hypothetical protein
MGIVMAAVAQDKGGEPLPEKYKENVLNNLQFAQRMCGKFLLSSAEDRIVIIWNMWSRQFSYSELAIELKPLIEAFESDLRKEYFYHYPRHKALMVLMTPGQWAVPIQAFPSIRPEVEAGVDCFAIGHNVACVFHMMRVAELGLRVIAKERRVTKVRKNTPVEWGTWNEVSRAISQKLEVIRNATAGPRKDAALAFYNAALSDLRALQGLYRDRTMHLRESYDDGQAQSAMLRTRNLMEMLASRLNEQSTRQIRWGL